MILYLVSPIQTVNNLQIIFTDQTYHIEIGAEVRLTCVVIGGNNPHVTWISPKGQLPPNTMTEHNGQTLIISGFDTADIGQYICVASDGLQFANHVFTVALSSTTTIKHTTEETSTSTKHGVCNIARENHK
ncbi:peroxidasin homolog pxn-2-like [Saccostrea cucullata]|uniref:peroxidasin homolog pxn-2-like n=1 Tax=Saccostrea cuccullata TaxID=36930 RepID=UPI002ED04EA7